MRRQRSLQNGRYADASDHSTGRPQVGHFTLVAIDGGCPNQEQHVSRKGTSIST
jgi:hypothetical protein